MSISQQSPLTRHKIHNLPEWSKSIRLLHWGGTLLFVAVWLMMFLHQNTADKQGLFINLHKAFGVTVFAWMAIQALSYLVAKTPSYAALNMAQWQIYLAKTVHTLLLLLFISMPIAGMLMSMYGNHPISVFGLFDLPMLVEPDPQKAKWWKNVHTEWIWPSILWVLGLHVFAVIYHKLKLKDHVLKRIS